MQPTTTVPPQQLGGPGVPGAARESRRYYDENGRFRTSREPVPVDQYGRIVGAKYGCRRCRTSRWYPAGLKGIPACERCDRRMTQGSLQSPPLLPWRELWDAVERPLRPVWALPALAAAGYAVDAAPVPMLVLVGAAPVAGELARRVAQAQMVRAKVARGRLEDDDPEGGKRLRAAIARDARHVGYGTAAGFGWLALAGALGHDTSTVAGRVALAVTGGVGLALWLAPAATWWRKLRLERDRREPVAEQAPEPGQPVVDNIDPTERWVRERWRNKLAYRRGEKVLADNGAEVVAQNDGKLAGTWLEDWAKVTGGWSATIVGPIGVYESDHFDNARGKIASAFSVRKAMVTVMPDAEDENQAMVMIQRSSPLRKTIRWAGPDSIDVKRGVAPMAMYADSTDVLYELYRPGWGSPHDFLCGTTGAGKSEALSTLLLIDRWAHYTDERGVKHGLVADLLIDPQQGQSYEPFMDDLAAPVAVELPEAMLMVHAFKQEMLRRNAYLSKRGWRDAAGVLHRAEWTDGKGRIRYGRKWWNPLVDGPILTLNIDEAHEFLSDKAFAALVTAGARMYRKCGMRIRVVTHTPLLTDLGGSMALRSMLTGGFVWVGRTADRLSGPTAFNGRLPADPCSLPLDAGTCFVMGGAATKPMVARTMWEPDYLDWIRNDAGEPIGFPAELSAATREAFGPEFAKWVQARESDELWVPEAGIQPQEPTVDLRCVDAVLILLNGASAPLNMDQIDGMLRQHGLEFSTRTIREALATLRKADPPMVETNDKRHRLTDRGAEEALTRAELVNS